MFGQDLNKLMENRDGYVYRTLFKHKPMFQQIMRHYDISDEQREYDILMDFYFYLRGDGEPFAMLDGIKNEKALPSWLKTVFSRYMSRHATFAERMSHDVSEFDKIPDNEDDSRTYSISDLNTAVLLIEQVNETYSAPERVIFFADLDALASKRHSTEEVLSVLHCTEGNLRVMRHRLKKRIRQTLAVIEQQNIKMIDDEPTIQ